MRKLPHLLLSVALLGAVLLFAPSATLAASYADAWANIDLSSITLTLTGTGSSSTSFEAYATSGDSNVTASAQGASPSLDATAQIDADTYWGWGLVDSESLYAGSYVEGSDPFSGWSYGDAAWYGQYQATTTGTITISFDYYLGCDVSSSAHETAYADAEAILTIGDESISYLLSIEAFNGMNFYNETTLQTLSLSYDIAAGDIIEFSALVSAQSEIQSAPVPAGIWLLGSGLAGLLGIRKKLFHA